MNKKKIFGYGSLINIESLKETVPEAENLKPVVLKGYKRVFDTASSNRFSDEENICVLNIEKDEDSKVNGVCFEVTEERFESLKERESGYNPVEVQVESKDEEMTAYVFIGDTEYKEYLHGDPAQEHYLNVCLEGARDFGEDFYEMFLETTFIGEKSLTELK